VDWPVRRPPDDNIGPTHDATERHTGPTTSVHPPNGEFRLISIHGKNREWQAASASSNTNDPGGGSFEFRFSDGQPAGTSTETLFPPAAQARNA
jgi:hypothetical protein